MSFVEGGTRCLSAIANVRCQGFSTIQEIGVYVPVVVQVMFIPFLIYRAWSKPVATLLFLSLEIASNVAVATWELAIHLSPTRMGSYQQQDVALGIISAVPLLFLLLTTMSIYLSLIRPVLPTIFRTTMSTAMFAILILPLIPIGFIGSLLGNVLLLVYQMDRRNATVTVGFSSPAQEWTHTVLVAIGAISTFIFLITSLTQFVLLHPPSRYAFSQTNLLSQSGIILSILGIGLFISAGEIILTLVPTSFALVITRQCLQAVSRGCLVLAFWMMYGKTSTDSAPWSSISDSTHQKTPGAPGWWASMTGHGKSGKSKEGKKLVIGSPLTDTFQRMSTERTREFHAGKPVLQVPHIEVKPAERVIFRMPPKRAPALSFTSSLFTNTSLAAVPQHPSPSPQAKRGSRYLPPGVENRAKMYVGSIYDPSRISVQADHLAQWPLPRPRSATTVPAPPPTAFTQHRLRPQQYQSRYSINGDQDNSPQVQDPSRNEGGFTPSSLDPESQLDWPIPPPRAITNPQSFHPYDQPLPAESPLDPDLPIPGLPPISKRHSSIPAIWTSDEALSRGYSVRDIPRGVRKNMTISTGLPRSNSARRKAVPRYEVYEDGPSKPPPRPIRRVHTAQKSVEVELDTSELMESSDIASSASFGTSPMDVDREKTVRRETDPTHAIDPEVSHLQGSRQGAETLGTVSPSNTFTPAVTAIPDTPDSPASMYTNNTRSLFFSTPIQSPTSSGASPSPRKSTYSPLRTSGLDTVIESSEGGNRRSSAEMKSVMASLYRITRDAGVRVDPGRLGIRDSQIVGLRNSGQSGVSGDSVYSKEALSEPQRKYRGGVI